MAERGTEAIRVDQHPIPESPHNKALDAYRAFCREVIEEWLDDDLDTSKIRYHSNSMQLLEGAEAHLIEVALFANPDGLEDARKCRDQRKKESQIVLVPTPVGDIPVRWRFGAFYS